MNNRKNIFIFFILLFSLSFGTLSYAFKFNIDSPKVMLEIKPGEKSIGYITVDSYGYNGNLEVRVYVMDVIYLPDGTNDFVPEGSTKWSLANWMEVEPKKFMLRGNTSQRVRYTVRVPTDAEGGRYGVIFFEVLLPVLPSSLRPTSTSSARIGSIVAVTAEGTDEYKADLTGLKAYFKETNVLTADCIVRNGGNTLIRPAGEFVILDLEGIEIAKKNMNPTEGGVLPYTSRGFEVEWKADELRLEKGKDYILQIMFDYGGESLLGGQTYFKIE